MRRLLLHPVVTAGYGAIVAALVTFFATDFAAQRAEYRAAQEAAYENNLAVSEDIDGLLVRFADIAAGETPKRAEDVSDLQAVVLRDRASAEELARLVPAARPAFRTLESSSTELMQRVNAFQDPRDAPAMAEAVGAYLRARQALHQTVRGDRASDAL